VLGWPYETGVTLARLIFSGIMDRYPDLKVIAHHLGGVIPISKAASATASTSSARAPPTRITGPSSSGSRSGRTIISRTFTATPRSKGRVRRPCAGSISSRPTTCCSRPTVRSTREGPGYIRDTIKVIDSLGLVPADKERSATAMPSAYSTGGGLTTFNVSSRESRDPYAVFYRCVARPV